MTPLCTYTLTGFDRIPCAVYRKSFPLMRNLLNSSSRECFLRRSNCRAFRLCRYKCQRGLQSVLPEAPGELSMHYCIRSHCHCDACRMNTPDAQTSSLAVVVCSLMMSGQITAPFFFDAFPFLKVNQLGLGCAASIGPAPALTQLSVALSLTIHNTTATGALGLDATNGVRWAELMPIVCSS